MEKVFYGSPSTIKYIEYRLVHLLYLFYTFQNFLNVMKYPRLKNKADNILCIDGRYFLVDKFRCELKFFAIRQLLNCPRRLWLQSKHIYLRKTFCTIWTNSMNKQWPNDRPQILCYTAGTYLLYTILFSFYIFIIW